MKHSHRFRDVEQEPTRPTTILEIMSTREFALGVADGRAGRPYPRLYDSWGIDPQWNYERGRQWARLAPRTVALRRDGKIARDALRWFTKDIL
jgi:hypothetical protein